MPLPVSGLEPDLRQPDGADELALHEAIGPAVSRALGFLAALSDGNDVAALTVTDFEVLLLRLRAEMMGDQCDLGFVCPHCAARVEVSLRVSDFLNGVRARRPAGVEQISEKTGWFRCDGAEFRLPTAGDQAAVAGSSDAAHLLAERCIAAPIPSGRVRQRIERAMSAMAPEVSRPLSGTCPDCKEAVEAPLHVARLVIGEFARDAAGLIDDVNLIAQTYHWPEATILQMPRRRRQAYADCIRKAA